jgi:hypothetical protein
MQFSFAEVKNKRESQTSDITSFSQEGINLSNRD